jgi:hypothetical protein
MTLRSKVLVALAGAALVVGACSTGTPTGSGATGGGPDGALVKRSDIKIEIVTHGLAQTASGASSATASGRCVTDGRDEELQRSGAESDIARHGLAHRRRGRQEALPASWSRSEPGCPRTGHQEAVDAGIPVVSMELGFCTSSRSWRVLVHVGQTEYEAGLGAGQRFKDAGVKKRRCFNQEGRQPGPHPSLQRLLHGAQGSEEGKV